MTKVERSTPIYFLPAKLFSTQTPPVRDCVTLVGEKGERKLVLVAELRMRRLVVRAHAEDDRLRFSNSPHASRIPRACFVHPGVSSRG